VGFACMIVGSCTCKIVFLARRRVCSFAAFLWGEERNVSIIQDFFSVLFFDKGNDGNGSFCFSGIKLIETVE